MDKAEIQRTLGLARAARQADRMDEAGRLLHALVDRSGGDPLPMNALGLHLLALGDMAGAATLFRRAIAADPRAPELWMNLAKAHREQGDDAAEQAALAGALAIDQRHFMAVVRQAELYDRTGRADEAVERWGGVLTMAEEAPDRTPALSLLLDHARDRVASHRAGFAAALDEGLASARAALPAADRRRFEACVDHALGRRRVYANQCAGLHVPFLPADEFFDRRHFPWLPGLEAQAATIRAELAPLLADGGTAFRPYVSMAPGTPANLWSPLDGSADWSALHLWKDGVRDDAACARAPRTAAIVEALPLSDLPRRTPTIFFSLLRPGAHLPAHTGVSNARAIVHLPLVAPPGCTFRVGGETRAWEEGRAWVFDDTIEHEAWNRSGEVRAILILDVWNPHIGAGERDLLRRFCAIADGNGHAGDAAVTG